MFRTVIGEIQIIRSRRKFARKRINLFDDRRDALLKAHLPYVHFGEMCDDADLPIGKPKLFCLPEQLHVKATP